MDLQDTTSAGRRNRRVTKVTQARAKSQRAKLDQMEQARKQKEIMQVDDEREEDVQPQTLQAKRRARMTVERAIGDYLDDHIAHEVRNEVKEELIVRQVSRSHLEQGIAEKESGKQRQI